MYVIQKLIGDILHLIKVKYNYNSRRYILHHSLSLRDMRRIRPRLLMPRLWGIFKGFVTGVAVSAYPTFSIAGGGGGGGTQKLEKALCQKAWGN